MARYIHRWFGLGYLLDDRDTKQKCWRSIPRHPQVLQAYMVRWNTLTAGATSRYFRTTMPISLLLVALGCLLQVVVFLLAEEKLQAAVAGLTFAYFAGMVMIFLWMLWRFRSYIMNPDQLPECTVCPVCAHVLDGVSPEPDGCTVCPTCKAAWRLLGCPRE
jgi:hypothetical protein